MFGAKQDTTHLPTTRCHAPCCRLALVVALVCCNKGHSNKPAANEEPQREDDRAVQSAETAKGAQLAALPYLNLTTHSLSQRRQGKIKTGVLRLVKEAVSPGFSLYNNHYRNRAQLIDLHGKTVHQWTSTAGFDMVSKYYPWKMPPYLGWHHIEMDSSGNLYVIVGYPPMPYGGVLAKLDWNSNLQWLLPIGAHHDLALGGHPDEVFALAFQLAPKKYRGRTYAVEEERLVHVVGGKVVDSISLNDVVANDHELAPLLANSESKLFAKCQHLIASPKEAKRLVYRKILHRYLDLYSAGQVLTQDGLKTFTFREDIQRELPKLLDLFFDATLSTRAGEAYRHAFNRLSKKIRANPPPAVKTAVTRYTKQLRRITSARKGLKVKTRAALNALADLCKANALHSNTIEIIQRDAPGLWKKGDFLTSFRTIDVVAVLRWVKGSAKIIWHYGPGAISMQHQPTITADNHVLIFDNGVSSKRSRAVKVDPRKKTIVWSYGDNEGEKPFYSWWKGGVEELPNGNVLISDTVTGETFEVTPQKRIVWLHAAPADSPTKVAQVYRMTRFSEDLIHKLDPTIGPSM